MPFVRSIILGKGEHVVADESDPHELDRFIQVQTQDFEIALAEIIGGRKRSHWMWSSFYNLPDSDSVQCRNATRG